MSPVEREERGEGVTSPSFRDFSNSKMLCGILVKLCLSAPNFLRNFFLRIAIVVFIVFYNDPCIYSGQIKSKCKQNHYSAITVRLT